MPHQKKRGQKRKKENNAGKILTHDVPSWGRAARKIKGKIARPVGKNLITGFGRIAFFRRV